MSRTLHSRLKPIVVGIIEAFSSDVAAEMILKLALNPEIQNAPPPDVSKSTRSVAAPSNGAHPPEKRGPGRPSTRTIAPPPLAEPIDPDREYSSEETAAIFGITKGTLLSWYAKPEVNMQVSKKRQGNGFRLMFKGSEVLRWRKLREQGAASEARNQSQQH